MITTIIFDMDGVLVDTEKYWKGLDFYRKFIPDWEEKYEKELTGMSVQDCYTWLKKNTKLTLSQKEFIEEHEKVAMDIAAKCSLLPHVKEFIEKAKNKGFVLAVASSAPRKRVDFKIERFGLADFFEVIVSGDDVHGNAKPAPDIYMHTAKLLRKEQKECIVIEDAHKGIIAAKAANMKCIGIKNGFNEDQDLSKADLKINTFEEIDLEKLNKI